MAIIILSVPHTGTRFLMSYLEHLKVVVRFYHTEQSTVDEMFYEQESKVIVPMRDPLLCFLSHCSESPSINPVEIASKVAGHWEILDSILLGHNHRFLRLDSVNRQEDLISISDFIGAQFKEGFVWKPVGVKYTNPSDYMLWSKLANKIGEEDSNIILTMLSMYRERYGY